MPPRKGVLVSLKDLLDGALKPGNPTTDDTLEILSVQWSALVGAPFDRHSKPVSVKGDRLLIEVDSPVWSQEISLSKPRILEKIRKEFPRLVIREIRFQTRSPEFRG